SDELKSLCPLLPGSKPARTAYRLLLTNPLGSDPASISSRARGAFAYLSDELKSLCPLLPGSKPARTAYRLLLTNPLGSD
ncbi:hypothetical protein CQA86_32360, partial [Klebsiella pneumoniae]